jgi:hypothetical protein
MTTEKVEKIKDTVKEGVLSTLRDDSALMWAGVIGLYQGLKYKGSLVNGIKGGLATLGVIAVVKTLKAIGKQN